MKRFDSFADELRNWGQFELVVDHGPFTLEARGASFLAHSVLSGDLGEQGAPYRFVVS